MSGYIWFKFIHISAIALWSAGLLYLPGLFAAHNQIDDEEEFRRLRQKTRLLYVALVSPAAVVAVLSGTVLVFVAASLGGWMVLKLIAVAGLVMVHTYFGRVMGILYKQPDFRPSWMHFALILPVVILSLIIIYLVTGKPV